MLKERRVKSVDFDRADLITINEIINESSDNISRVISSVNEIYATY